MSIDHSVSHSCGLVGLSWLLLAGVAAAVVDQVQLGLGHLKARLGWVFQGLLPSQGGLSLTLCRALSLQDFFL